MTYLHQWPDVDVDVKQKFQFGGIGALYKYDMGMLVIPDPLHIEGLQFESVFDYEQVLVVGKKQPLASLGLVASVGLIKPQQLS